MMMEKSLFMDMTPKTDSEYESAVDLHLKGMLLLQEQMKSDRHEIETLRAETDVILADIMQTLRVA
jgi:hypothetical protein